MDSFIPFKKNGSNYSLLTSPYHTTQVTKRKFIQAFSYNMIAPIYQNK